MLEATRELAASPSDRQLLERFCDGDQQSFVQFSERYSRPLYRFAFLFFHNAEDAQEIVQETMMRLLEKADLWQEGQQVKSWLYRICRNLCIDRYRKYQRGERQTVDLLELRQSGREPVASGPTPHQVLQGELILQALGQLSEKQRSVFLLRHQHGLKLEEIAATLEVSLGTVKTLHHRAMKGVRKALGHQEVASHVRM